MKECLELLFCVRALSSGTTAPGGGKAAAQSARDSPKTDADHGKA